IEGRRPNRFRARRVPSAGLEPAHPAPEAGALSTELRGLGEPSLECVPAGPRPAASWDAWATLRTPMIEQRLIALVAEALTAAASELGLTGDLPEIELSKPRQKEHGDFSTNVALVVAAQVNRPPRDVAEVIVRHLPPA